MFRNLFPELLKMCPSEKYNFSSILINENITQKMIEKNFENIHCKLPNNGINLTEEFIEKYSDGINWLIVVQESMYILEVVQKYPKYMKLLWDFIPFNPYLTEEFIEKYSDKLDWHRLTRNPNLTPEFIERNLNKFKSSIFKHPGVKVEIIEKYSDRADWAYISKNPNLTERFIEENQKKLSWDFVSKITSQEILEKFLDKINWRWLSKNTSLTTDFIIKYCDKLSWEMVSACGRLDLSHEGILNLIEKYRERNNWYHLSRDHIDLSTKTGCDFVEKYKSEIVWIVISSNPTITLEFIKKYEDKIVWEKILRNRLRMDPNIRNKNKKRYSECLKKELVMEINKREQRIFNQWKSEIGPSLDIIKLRKRDLDLGLRKAMI